MPTCGKVQATRWSHPAVSRTLTTFARQACLAGRVVWSFSAKVEGNSKKDEWQPLAFAEFHTTLYPLVSECFPMVSLSRAGGGRVNRIAVCVGGLACLFGLAAMLITLSGHDYAYFLPRLHDNHLFYGASGLALKEYSASFCAGIFEFANPQSLALSLPQLLSSVFGPLLGMQFTFVIMSATAGFGLYFCARHAGLASMPAGIAATMMAFNGFLITRLVVGHVTFFNFAMVPMIAALLLYGVGHASQRRFVQAFALGGGASLLAVSTVYGGGGVILPQMSLAVVLILLVCGGFAVGARYWLAFYGAVSLMALLMASPKLEAMLAVTGELTRTQYPLPGIGLLDIPMLIFQTLFWIPDAGGLSESFQNVELLFDFHEWNFTVTPGWILLVIAGILAGRRAGRESFASRWRPTPRILILIFLLILPIALNVYHPVWNQFLKTVPVLESSSSMLRWLVVYPPLLCLLAGWSWRHLEDLRAPPLLALMICLGVIHYQAISQNLTPGQMYQKETILSAWSQPRPSPVSEVGAPIRTNADGSRQPIYDSNFDHMFTTGVSNVLCYEPLFGYRLEKLPIRHVRLGSIERPDDGGRLGLKNPACYVYPAENSCAPGDHFKTGQMADMRRLVAYESPNLEISGARRILNLIALVTLSLALLLTACTTTVSFRTATGRSNQ